MIKLDIQDVQNFLKDNNEGITSKDLIEYKNEILEHILFMKISDIMDTYVSNERVWNRLFKQLRECTSDLSPPNVSKYLTFKDAQLGSIL